MVRPPSQIGTRPVITRSDAAVALRRWWGIDGELDDLPSERDRNFVVRGLDGSPALVFKVANLEEELTFLECQHEAMARLERAGVPVQRVVPSSDGRDVVGLGDPGPPWVRVLSWLPGRTLASVEAPQAGLWNDLGAAMGRAASALAGFDHPAARRAFQWDVMQASGVIAARLGDVPEPRRRALLGDVLGRLRQDLAPRLRALRRGTIHNDANDHNVLVEASGSRVVGLLDFGDMVRSVTAQEAAVACAYAMFGAADPADIARRIVAGFDSTCRLTADELDAMPSLILARLGASVAISAHQSTLAPEDPYLSVSEESAWDLLGWFMKTPASALRIAFHEAAGR